MEPGDLIGEWQGFLNPELEEDRVVLRIAAGEAGLAARVDTPDGGDLDVPVESVTVAGDALTLEAPAAGARFTGRLDAAQGVIAGDLVLGGFSFPLRLMRGNPAFRKFQVPRLDTAGTPITNYHYHQPAPLDDGLPISTPAAEGVREAPVLDLMNAILASRYPQAHSVLLVRHGRLVVEEYFYGHHRDRLHGFQSCTKSITSLLVGIALGRGEIKSVDDLVHTYFPERRGCRWIDAQYPLTLRHILTMTAALDWDETVPYTDPRNDAAAMNLSPDWVGYVLNKALAGAPGEKYAYTSGLSILLGALLKNATGLYADEYAERHLFGPLGITRYRWDAAPDGARHTGGGLSLRPIDAAKLGALVLAGGRWQDRQVVPEGWVRESTRRHTRPDDYGYGYQWHRPDFVVNGRALDAVAAAGYGGQWLFLFPEFDLGAVFTAGCYGGDSRPHEKIDQFILPAVI